LEKEIYNKGKARETGALAEKAKAFRRIHFRELGKFDGYLR